MVPGYYSRGRTHQTGILALMPANIRNMDFKNLKKWLRDEMFI